MSRELDVLNRSYSSLEENIHEQLGAAVAAAHDTAVSSYRIISDYYIDITRKKIQEIQQEYNNHKLDELSTDRIIADIIIQLKKKGVAVIDFSDVFIEYPFELLRKEFMARIAKRIKAFL